MDAKRIVTGSGIVLALVLFWCGTSRATTACFSTHTSGSGATFMKICISFQGNLVQFESPASEEHIRVPFVGEGYVLCSASGVHGFDAGFDESGFSFFGTITQPNGTNTFR